MIIARGKGETGELLILGLSAVNVLRIMQGKPLVIKRETHGDGVPEGWEIVIIAGETEASLFADMKKSGVIAPDTEVIKENKLGQEGT